MRFTHEDSVDCGLFSKATLTLCFRELFEIVVHVSINGFFSGLAEDETFRFVNIFVMFLLEICNYSK